MRKVTIYDTELCTTCWSVQSLLDKREIPYEHVVVPEDSDEHRALAERTGMQTLPQVFIGSVLHRRLRGDRRRGRGRDARRSARRLSAVGPRREALHFLKS